MLESPMFLLYKSGERCKELLNKIASINQKDKIDNQVQVIAEEDDNNTS